MKNRALLLKVELLEQQNTEGNVSIIVSHFYNFFADVYLCFMKIVTLKNTETTSLGVAIIAAVS